MPNLDIARQRLYNQRIARQNERTFDGPVAVVQWLGAVQAQDYAAAKWALGLRLPGASNDDIEQAMDDGAILRTHVLRPTWHFVSPSDIRWMLAITAPRIKAGVASRYRQLELDDTIFKRCNAVLVQTLQGGRQLTRPELVSAFNQAGMVVDGQRFPHIMMHAELDGIVCSGASRGKQYTYALLDERASQIGTIDRDEALARLTGRYFTSHGPATLQDFVWWSGLTVADARAGLAMVKSQLTDEMIDDQTYWLSPSTPSIKGPVPTLYLLPNFDEYIVAYTDRSTIFDPSHVNRLDARANVLFNHTIVMDGQIVGTWKRTFKGDTAVLTPNFFAPLNAVEQSAFAAAAERYTTFLRPPE
jgi:hypothetical protein